MKRSLRQLRDLEIKRLYASGEKMAQIGDKMGTSKQRISQILEGTKKTKRTTLRYPHKKLDLALSIK